MELNGFIYDINYKGKKIYCFIASDKKRRNTNDAIRIYTELEKILDVNKEKYGNIYETVKKKSIETIKEKMEKVAVNKYKNFYGIRGKYYGFTTDENDEVVILN
jgi:hypothetical protein